jgi:membrane peptidoglycan carboxypeptidase
MQAPPRHRPTSDTPMERLPFRIPKGPLWPLLLALTIGVCSVLVALLLLPLFGAVGVGAKALEKRLTAAGANFTRIPHFPQRSTIYARDGSILATLFLDENRTIVHLDKVSQHAQDAVLAIEDHNFYEHGAINVSSVIRAMLANLIAGHVTQGGSTLTQQLVKNAVIQSDAQTFARKFQEAALAIRLEQTYSKDKILELYMNEVYFGNGIYGIGTAARYYFNEPASKLDLAQSALLAGLIQSPATFDPMTHPDAALARRNEVLDHMAEYGLALPGKVTKVKLTPIRLATDIGRQAQQVQPFFVHYINELILDKTNHAFDAFGKTHAQRVHTLFQGGLKIYTTLDPAWQRYAQEAVNESPNIDPKTGPDVSLVSVDPTNGAIRAMLSGKNYRRDQLDLVWHGRRQVGSAFKPFTLAAAFEQGFPPGKVYDSQSPFCSPLWISADHCVSNAEGGGGGYVDLWTATQNSINVVFAQLALDVGPQNIVDVAHKMGITAPLDAVPAITLGTEEVSTLDMASGYSTLANNGIYCEPFAVARVLLPNGTKLYQHHPTCDQAIPADIAHQITAMLQRVICCGTGQAYASGLGRPEAGKTGTGQDYTNVYFAGYTPQMTTAVWVGFPAGNIPMDSYYGHSVFGGTLAAPIWKAFMLKALAGMPIEGFPAPPPQQSGAIPDVVGMHSAEAQKTLVTANFTPIIEKVDSILPVNTVIAQTPAGGTSAVLGSGVTLSVSTGKGVAVTVPRVTGLTEAQAVKALDKAGLKAAIVYADVTDPAQDGLVLSQSPIGNKQATKGDTVTITIGKLKAKAPAMPRRRR